MIFNCIYLQGVERCYQDKENGAVVIALPIDPSGTTFELVRLSQPGETKNKQIEGCIYFTFKIILEFL